MPNYKSLFDKEKISQKQLTEHLKSIDPRVDKHLISKIIEYVCLPTPAIAKTICEYLECSLTELYDHSELLTVESLEHPLEKKKKKRNAKEFNLNVRIERALVERVFNPASLRKLGIKDKSSAIRSYILSLEKKLERIEREEKSSQKN